ncbi:hypothetical protein ABZ557_29900 [Streptomyces sp. NPDC019645]|uniref:hypothetical protein n=1 Tax=Streptomyces sp. NPDC019645 TaxID=3154786 RepID=UPI00340BD3D1
MRDEARQRAVPGRGEPKQALDEGGPGAGTGHRARLHQAAPLPQEQDGGVLRDVPVAGPCDIGTA